MNRKQNQSVFCTDLHVEHSFEHPYNFVPIPFRVKVDPLDLAEVIEQQSSQKSGSEYQSKHLFEQKEPASFLMDVEIIILKTAVTSSKMV